MEAVKAVGRKTGAFRGKLIWMLRLELSVLVGYISSCPAFLGKNAEHSFWTQLPAGLKEGLQSWAWVTKSVERTGGSTELDLKTRSLFPFFSFSCHSGCEWNLNFNALNFRLLLLIVNVMKGRLCRGALKLILKRKGFLTAVSSELDLRA